jgi:predicted Zn-dependent peptidase
MNGIPVFQAEVPGRVRAGLEFRVGTADEPLHMAGVTHLIEHLALSGVGGVPYEYNGFVDQTHTGFTVAGTPDQVVDFFDRVTAALQALPTDRVATERRIIETEAAGHHQSSFRGSLSLRYGATGFGIADYRQIGLLWLTPQAVQGWAAQHFTAGNAAAWVAGPVIPGLKLQLTAGIRFQPPALTPKRLILPCVVDQPGLGATASMVANRSTALWAGLTILERRAMQRIRFSEGLSYTAATAVQQLDGRTVHVLAMTDALPEHSTKAGSALLDIADVLSLTGPDAAEIQEVIARLDESFSDPQSLVGEMQSMVHDELLGVTPRTLQQTRDELALLTPSVIASALKPALDSMILIMPEGTQSPRPHFAPYPLVEAHPLPGSEVQHVYTPGMRMVVGPAGISMCDSNRRAFNINWQEVAVGAQWDDGSRQLIGRDGTEILFRPRVWRNPALILAAIDGNVAADRVIHADGPSPSADLPPPPKQRGTGSIIGGRGAMLLVGGGILLIVIAAIAFYLSSR